jgi:uncharacterized membrane protein YgcG
MLRRLPIWKAAGFVLLFALTAARAAAQAQVQYQPLSPDQLDQLTSRIALDPDALLSEILVACTYPQEVVDAAQWLSAGNNAAAVNSMPWDPSVKGLANFPGLLQQLAGDPNWLNDMGAAFLNQQPDVMNSVQRLRAQAIANGVLYSTSQQQVIQDGDVVEIIPSNPDEIYVPTYDPNIFFDQPGLGVPYAGITFGDGIGVGAWLGYDWDWYDHRLYHGDWGRDRPWWHWQGGRPRYMDVRPGHVTPPAGAHWNPTPWARDAHRPPPVMKAPPPARGPLPDRGFAQQEQRQDEINRGFAAQQDAERGRASRAVAEPRPAEPVRVAPEPEREPAREAPVREAPAPPREPDRAPGGYEGGGDAARASERGAESRGGGGGGGGGGARGGGGGGRR